jgi:hypothetical protein
MLRGLPIIFTMVSTLQQMVVITFKGIVNLNPSVFEG